MFDTIQFLDRIERLYPEQEFNSTFRRATLSKDVSAVINMTALFGRIEDNDLFKDFERCIKSQDPSSIIRVMTELLSVDDIHADKANNFRSAVLGQDPAGLITTSSHLLVDYDITDVRSAVLGGDLTAILRLLSNLNTPQLNKVDLEPLEDLKASVTAQDPPSINRTLGRL